MVQPLKIEDPTVNIDCIDKFKLAFLMQFFVKHKERFHFPRLRLQDLYRNVIIESDPTALCDFVARILRFLRHNDPSVCIARVDEALDCFVAEKRTNHRLGVNNARNGLFIFQLDPAARAKLLENLVESVYDEQPDLSFSSTAAFNSTPSDRLNHLPSDSDPLDALSDDVNVLIKAGQDASGCSYYYMDDLRLYRESPQSGLSSLWSVAVGPTAIQWRTFISSLSRLEEEADLCSFLKHDLFSLVNDSLDAMELFSPNEDLTPCHILRKEEKELLQIKLRRGLLSSDIVIPPTSLIPNSTDTTFKNKCSIKRSLKSSSSPATNGDILSSPSTNIPFDGISNHQMDSTNSSANPDTKINAIYPLTPTKNILTECSSTIFSPITRVQSEFSDYTSPSLQPIEDLVQIKREPSTAPNTPGVSTSYTPDSKHITAPKQYQYPNSVGTSSAKNCESSCADFMLSDEILSKSMIKDESDRHPFVPSEETRSRSNSLHGHTSAPDLYGGIISTISSERYSMQKSITTLSTTNFSADPRALNSPPLRLQYTGPNSIGASSNCLKISLCNATDQDLMIYSNSVKLQHPLSAPPYASTNKSIHMNSKSGCNYFPLLSSCNAVTTDECLSYSQTCNEQPSTPHKYTLKKESDGLSSSTSISDTFFSQSSLDNRAAYVSAKSVPPSLSNQACSRQLRVSRSHSQKQYNVTTSLNSCPYSIVFTTQLANDAAIEYARFRTPINFFHHAHPCVREYLSNDVNRRSPDINSSAGDVCNYANRCFSIPSTSLSSISVCDSQSLTQEQWENRKSKMAQLEKIHSTLTKSKSASTPGVAAVAMQQQNVYANIQSDNGNSLTPGSQCVPHSIRADSLEAQREWERLCIDHQRKKDSVSQPTDTRQICPSFCQQASCGVPISLRSTSPQPTDLKSGPNQMLFMDNRQFSCGQISSMDPSCSSIAGPPVLAVPPNNAFGYSPSSFLDCGPYPIPMSVYSSCPDPYPPAGHKRSYNAVMNSMQHNCSTDQSSGHLSYLGMHPEINSLSGIPEFWSSSFGPCDSLGPNCHPASQPFFSSGRPLPPDLLDHSLMAGGTMFPCTSSYPTTRSNLSASLTSSTGNSGRSSRNGTSKKRKSVGNNRTSAPASTSSTLNSHSNSPLITTSCNSHGAIISTRGSCSASGNLANAGMPSGPQRPVNINLKQNENGMMCGRQQYSGPSSDQWLQHQQHHIPLTPCSQKSIRGASNLYSSPNDPSGQSNCSSSNSFRYPMEYMAPSGNYISSNDSSTTTSNVFSTTPVSTSTQHLTSDSLARLALLSQLTGSEGLFSSTTTPSSNIAAVSSRMSSFCDASLSTVNCFTSPASNTFSRLPANNWDPSYGGIFQNQTDGMFSMPLQYQNLSGQQQCGIPVSSPLHDMSTPLAPVQRTIQENFLSGQLTASNIQASRQFAKVCGPGMYSCNMTRTPHNLPPDALPSVASTSSRGNSSAPISVPGTISSNCNHVSSLTSSLNSSNQPQQTVIHQTQPAPSIQVNNTFVNAQLNVQQMNYQHVNGSASNSQMQVHFVQQQQQQNLRPSSGGQQQMPPMPCVPQGSGFYADGCTPNSAFIPSPASPIQIGKLEPVRMASNSYSRILPPSSTSSLTNQSNANVQITLKTPHTIQYLPAVSTFASSNQYPCVSGPVYVPGDSADIQPPDTYFATATNFAGSGVQKMPNSNMSSVILQSPACPRSGKGTTVDGQLNRIPKMTSSSQIIPMFVGDEQHPSHQSATFNDRVSHPGSFVPMRMMRQRVPIGISSGKLENCSSGGGIMLGPDLNPGFIYGLKSGNFAMQLENELQSVPQLGHNAYHSDVVSQQQNQVLTPSQGLQRMAYREHPQLQFPTAYSALSRGGSIVSSFGHSGVVENGVQMSGLQSCLEMGLPSEFAGSTFSANGKSYHNPLLIREQQYQMSPNQLGMSGWTQNRWLPGAVMASPNQIYDSPRDLVCGQQLSATGGVMMMMSSASSPTHAYYQHGSQLAIGAQVPSEHSYQALI